MICYIIINSMNRIIILFVLNLICYMQIHLISTEITQHFFYEQYYSIILL